MNDGAKKQLFHAVLFTGTILAFFLILSLFSVLGRKSWERGLRAAVEQVLSPDEFTLGEFVKIDSSLSVSAACFEVLQKNSPSKKSLAVILRATGYWGPLPAVFLCQDGKAEFKGIAYMNNSAARAFLEAKDDRQILYWQDVARDIAAAVQAASKTEAKK